MAFESIDGPPAAVFETLVAAIAEEAGARQVAVVSRTGPADYRVRGYMSALVSRSPVSRRPNSRERGPREQVSIAWVWDVYDADRRRVLRIAGEEPAGGGQPDAWAAADRTMLHRIARNGMERVAAFLTAPRPAAPSEPGQAAVAAASGEAPRAVAFRAQP